MTPRAADPAHSIHGVSRPTASDRTGEPVFEIAALQIPPPFELALTPSPVPTNTLPVTAGSKAKLNTRLRSPKTNRIRLQLAAPSVLLKIAAASVLVTALMV